MSKQPEALRLADLIEWTTVQQDLTEAAAELRRLHLQNQDLLDVLVDVMFRHVPFSNKKDYAERARAAIAKATKEQA